MKQYELANERLREKALEIAKEKIPQDCIKKRGLSGKVVEVDEQYSSYWEEAVKQARQEIIKEIHEKADPEMPTKEDTTDEQR